MNFMERGGEMEDYERALERGKELLSSSYDEQKFGSVMASFIGAPLGLNAALQELEADLSAAGTEQEKEVIRTAWLRREDLATQVSEELQKQQEEEVA